MSRKANIICIVICVVITLALIGGIIYGVVRNSNDTPPDETQPPITDTTEPEDSDTEPVIPNIPDIESNDTGGAQEEVNDNGEIHLDVGAKNDNSNVDEPAVKDFIVIDGVKEKTEE